MTTPVRWPEVLSHLLEGQELDAETAQACLDCILAGQATSAQIAGFLVALKARGERPDELVAMLVAVRAAGVPVLLPGHLASAAMDVVGTGGDGTSSVNLSTMAALVVAGAGVPVCKHGNRAASSACGAADVLEELGVALEISPQAVAACVEQAGIGFCFAPRFHPAFRFAGPTRKELGVSTVFNLLGPLANPAQVTRLLVGTASPRTAELVAQVLAGMGHRHAWVVHGPDGLDELSTGGPNLVFDVRGGEVTQHLVEPRGLGLMAASVDDLRGGDARFNAGVVREVLAGRRGPVRDAVVLNAAAALVVADVVEGLDDGVGRAQLALDSGAAAAALQRLVEVSQEQVGESTG
jgi:anthranilate phosphoribosyltransferase